MRRSRDACHTTSNALEAPIKANYNGKLSSKASAMAVHFEFIMLLGFWLDGVDDVVEGLWKWASTDANLSYTDWYPGQPSNGGSTHNDRFHQTRDTH
jgi:hypothetical protein